MSLPPVNRLILVLPQQYARLEAECSRIEKIVLDYLLKSTKSPEEESKVRTYISQTFFGDWPVVPPEQVLPPHCMEYFKEIRHSWCLDDKMVLYQLWSVDIFNKLEELIAIANPNKSLAGLQKIKRDLAAIVLLFSVIYEQRHLKMKFFLIDNSLAYWVSRFSFNLPKIRDLREELALLQTQEVSAIQAVRHKKNHRKNQAPPKKTEAEEKYTYILRALDIGIEIWGDPYYQQYFFRYELGACLPKSPIHRNPIEDIKQVNTYIRMVSTAWTEVNLRRWVSTIHSSVLSIPPSPPEDKINAESAQEYRRQIQKLSIELFNFHWKILSLCFQIPTRMLTWKTCEEVLGTKFDPSQISMPVADWVTDAASCCNVGAKELPDILRLFEGGICKNLLPQFCSFEELLNRIDENFKKVFVVKEDRSSFSLHLEPFAQGALHTLMNGFFSDLTKIHREFDQQIRRHLPPSNICQLLVEILSMIKGPLNLISIPLTESLYPFKEAVIFAATKALPAFEKGQKIILQRFENALKSVDASMLSEKKEDMMPILKALCLFRFKPYLDLFMLLRDIHVVLLAPIEGSQAWEKGLHLLPQELAQFLQLSQLENLIDARIQQQKTEPIQPAPEKVEDILSLLVSIDLSLEENKTAVIPPIQLNESKESIETLQMLSELDKFKIRRGEKTRIIRTRLKKMGVYVIRTADGSHIILGHPNTKITFSLPDHDEISRGVAEDLADWVNRHILGLKE